MIQTATIQDKTGESSEAFFSQLEKCEPFEIGDKVKRVLIPGFDTHPFESVVVKVAYDDIKLEHSCPGIEYDTRWWNADQFEKIKSDVEECPFKVGDKVVHKYAINDDYVYIVTALEWRGRFDGSREWAFNLTYEKDSVRAGVYFVKDFKPLSSLKPIKKRVRFPFKKGDKVSLRVSPSQIHQGIVKKVKTTSKGNGQMFISWDWGNAWTTIKTYEEMKETFKYIPEKGN